MKLAVSNLAWPVADDTAAAAVLRTCGVRGVELAPSKVWECAPYVVEGAAESYAGWWRDADCAVVAFQAIIFGHAELDLFGDDPIVAALRQHLSAMGRLAARCGASVLVLGAPANRRKGRRLMSDAVTAAARALRPAVEELASVGVSLCIEPNPPRYGCDFVNTAAEAAQLVEAVGHPNCGIHLDTAALALSGETTAKALAPIIRQVRHVHLSEVDLVPVGTSESVPHDALGAALQSLGYDGWLSVEMRAGAADAWRDALPRAVAVARTSYGC